MIKSSMGRTFRWFIPLVILGVVVLIGRFGSPANAQSQGSQGSSGAQFSRVVVGPLSLPSGVVTSNVKGNGPGLTIVPTFDPSINAATQAVINKAISFYNHAFRNNSTVSIYFYNMNSGLGQSEYGLYVIPYTTYRPAWAANPTSADDTTALANTPSGTNNPVSSSPNMTVNASAGRAIGLSTSDVSLGSPCPISFTGSGCIGLNVSQANTIGDLISVVQHEIDEVLGLGSSISGTAPQFDPTPEDLFRWASAGTRSYTGNSQTTIPCTGAPSAFFSIDGGSTNIDQFNNCNNGGDYGDWIEHTPSQVQDAFTNGSAAPWLNVNSAEARALDVIGYNIAFTHFADKAVFRPSNGTWYVIPRTNPGSPIAQQWGTSTDITLRGDFDGDGKNDIVVWRPSNGTWYIIPSSNPGTPILQSWGANGDIPVPGDYDGDGVTDFAVFRPSNGTWYVIPSSNSGTPIIKQWGTSGDVPVPGDYDGDRMTDFAVWRPTNGTWYVIPSSNPGAPILQQWGATVSGVQDHPVPGDYDGDGKTDFAVWRPSNGVWYIIPSGNPGTPILQEWGATLGGVQDVPVPVDYDGDTRTDLAIWRPGTGVWYVLPSTAPGTFAATSWGTANDIPVERPIGQ